MVRHSLHCHHHLLLLFTVMMNSTVCTLTILHQTQNLACACHLLLLQSGRLMPLKSNNFTQP